MSDSAKRPEEPNSFEEGERVCAELGGQIERARKVLRDYREAMGEEPEARHDPTQSRS